MYITTLISFVKAFCGHKSCMIPAESPMLTLGLRREDFLVLATALQGA